MAAQGTAIQGTAIPGIRTMETGETPATAIRDTPGTLITLDMGAEAGTNCHKKKIKRKGEGAPAVGRLFRTYFFIMDLI
jgi:hypothetical protein